MSVIYRNTLVVIYNKECGEPAQPGRQSLPSALQRAETEVESPLFVVHRLDQPVSGLMLFARSHDGAARLSEELAAHRITRHYLAIVEGRVSPASGTLRNTLFHDKRRNRSRVEPNGKPAELAYKTVAEGERYTVLHVVLTTGRHHQIRVQLSAAGWPVRGDVKYGARRTIPGGGIGLHAFRLIVPAPASTGLDASAPPPERDIWHKIAPSHYLSPARVIETENR